MSGELLANWLSLEVSGFALQLFRSLSFSLSFRFLHFRGRKEVDKNGVYAEKKTVERAVFRSYILRYQRKPCLLLYFIIYRFLRGFYLSPCLLKHLINNAISYLHTRVCYNKLVINVIKWSEENANINVNSNAFIGRTL